MLYLNLAMRQSQNGLKELVEYLPHLQKLHKCWKIWQLICIQLLVNQLIMIDIKNKLNHYKLNYVSTNLKCVYILQQMKKTKKTLILKLVGLSYFPNFNTDQDIDIEVIIKRKIPQNLKMILQDLKNLLIKFNHVSSDNYRH